MHNGKYKRIFTIVVDSLGVGAAEDAEYYGDKGTDTLGHISSNVKDFHIPNLMCSMPKCLTIYFSVFFGAQRTVFQKAIDICSGKYRE